MATNPALPAANSPLLPPTPLPSDVSMSEADRNNPVNLHRTSDNYKPDNGSAGHPQQPTESANLASSKALGSKHDGQENSTVSETVKSSAQDVLKSPQKGEAKEKKSEAWWWAHTDRMRMFSGGKKLNKGSKRGRAAITNIRIKKEEKFIERLYSSYILLLRMPVYMFIVVIICFPIIISTVFSFVYMLDENGLVVNTANGGGGVWLREGDVVGQNILAVFFYSLSLSTTLGCEKLQAHSPFTLMVANLNTLCAQLAFVFISGAVFHRLSRPGPPVRFAKWALITEDKNNLEDSQTGPSSRSKQPYKTFMARLVLVGGKTPCLIDAKFTLSMRRFITVPSQGSSFVLNSDLALVRSDAHYFRFGTLLRHVIDESSPLFGRCDRESLLAEDASFSITVSGLEQSSMQPAFGEVTYTVFDGEVLWGREFADIMTFDPHTNAFAMDHSKLSHLKPIPAPIPNTTPPSQSPSLSPNRSPSRLRLPLFPLSRLASPQRSNPPSPPSAKSSTALPTVPPKTQPPLTSTSGDSLPVSKNADSTNAMASVVPSSSTPLPTPAIPSSGSTSITSDGPMRIPSGGASGSLAGAAGPATNQAKENTSSTTSPPQRPRPISNSAFRSQSPFRGEASRAPTPVPSSVHWASPNLSPAAALAILKHETKFLSRSEDSDGGSGSQLREGEKSLERWGSDLPLMEQREEEPRRYGIISAGGSIH
eukprot:TRINITY_DN13652_c0_g2_i1.p1 TRINITY_DN13652_c0_g2~~TRINITY_DN13652_c0_g2_i1.p1  ORF type:complete len:708 (-),score=100.12 TRINITY_DN13652_c0_g2_i1:115-2238(-)